MKGTARLWRLDRAAIEMSRRVGAVAAGRGGSALAGCGRGGKFWAATSGMVALALLAACATPPPPPEIEFPVYPPPPAPARFIYERTITGSGDVIEETRSDKLKRFATGETIRGRGFAKPFDIVVRSGRLYVSDTVSRRVHMIDLVEKRYAEIGVKGYGRLTKPLGMDLDDFGRLYVCDGSAKRVVVYGPEGEYLTAFGGEEFLERPTGVAVSGDGGRIYVVDTGGVRSPNHGIYVFDGEGRHIGERVGRGAGPGEFNLPLSAAIGPDGGLRVLDTGNFRIQAFSPDLSVIDSFGKPGRYAGNFSHAKGVDIDAEGRIYVSDTGFGVVQIFTPDGRILMSLGNRSENPAPGALLLPAGVAVDFDGRVYVVDQFYRKIDVFRPAFLPEDWPIGRNYREFDGAGFSDDLAEADVVEEESG